MKPPVAAVLSFTVLSGSLAGAASAQSYWSGSGNFLLGNNCESLIGATVSLHVTQDMVATASGGDLSGQIPNGGFALQLNATPPQGPSYPVFWLQYIIYIKHNLPTTFIQYFDNAGVNNPANVPILNLPSNMVPAGYVLTIALANDPATGNVIGTTFSVTDDAGKTNAKSGGPMPTYAGTNGNSTVLAPIKVFLVNVVGSPSDENSTLSSGAGYITYGVSSGQLSVTPSSACGVRTAIEGSNASYGTISPSVGKTLIQPLTTPFAGALSSNVDSADNAVVLYHFTQYPPVGQNPNTGNFYLGQLGFNGGTWSSTNVTTTAGSPAATLGSPVASYENTVYNAPEAFYFVPNAQGGQQVEQLWSKSWNPNSLTSETNAQPAAMGSGLVGYIDSVASTDNVFYQGIDQHVHALVWSPSGGWAEDTRLANAPVATFASALTGHMNAQSEEVFYIGTNQHIYERWRWSRNFDGWHSTDLTPLGSVVAVGSPLVGFYDPHAGSDTVFYLGSDRHVHELRNASAGWTGVDVTVASHATLLAEAGSALAAHLNTIVGSEEVFFVNSDQTMGEAWSWSTTTPSWNSANLFHGAAGSPPVANAGSPLATDIDSVSSAKTDELYYIGTDGNVYELSWSPNTEQWTSSTP